METHSLTWFIVSLSAACIAFGIVMAWFQERDEKKARKRSVMHSVTCGEIDEEGSCYLYVNGEKTNVKVLVWTEEEIERLHKIAEKIHKENDSK